MVVGVGDAVGVGPGVGGVGVVGEVPADVGFEVVVAAAGAGEVVGGGETGGVGGVARQTSWQGCCVSPEGDSELWEDPHRFLLRRRPGSC